MMKKKSNSGELLFCLSEMTLNYAKYNAKVIFFLFLKVKRTGGKYAETK